MKTVTVTISPTGETKVEADGFTGSSCEAMTKPIEDALGVRSSNEYKPEFHRACDQSLGQSQQ